MVVLTVKMVYYFTCYNLFSAMTFNNGTFGLPLFDGELLPRGIIACILLFSLLMVHLEQRQLLLLYILCHDEK